MDDKCHYYFVNLSLILYAYNEEIVGWSVGPILDTDYLMADLRMSLKRIEWQNVSRIHHSDLRCQYASRMYTDTLRSNGIDISMTEYGDPKDNAQTERINNTMKNELMKYKVFSSMDKVIVAVAVTVNFYNNRRPHMSIGMMKPSEAVLLTGERDMKWTNYRQMAIKNSNRIAKTEYHLLENPCQGSPSGLQPTVNP